MGLISDIFGGSNQLDYNSSKINLNFDGFKLNIITNTLKADIKSLKYDNQYSNKIFNFQDTEKRTQTFLSLFNKSKIELIDFIIHEIKINPLYKEVPCINIYLMGGMDARPLDDKLSFYKMSSALGWVMTREIKQGKYNIYLNIPLLMYISLEDNIYSLQKERIRDTLQHEQEHIIHEIKNHVFVDEAIIRKRIYKALYPYHQALISEYKKFFLLGSWFDYKKCLMLLRESISLLMRGIHTEGFARYFENTSKYTYTFSSWKDNYWKAYYAVRELNRNFESIIDILFYFPKHNAKSDLKTFKLYLDSISGGIEKYDIGAFMVYTIIFYNNKTFEEILYMSVYQFFKEYESAMTKSGLEPVVSLNSGKGMLDFNSILGRISKEVDKKSLKD